MLKKLTAITVILLLSLTAFAGGDEAKKDDKDKTKKETKTQKTEQKATGGAGMIVSIDPERGSINENPQISREMAEALSRMVNTSSEGLEEQRLPDGTVIVDLQGRFQSAVVATIGPDGKVHTNCYSQDPNHKHDHKHQEKVKKEEKPEKKAKEKK